VFQHAPPRLTNDVAVLHNRYVRLFERREVAPNRSRRHAEFVREFIKRQAIRRRTKQRG